MKSRVECDQAVFAMIDKIFEEAKRGELDLEAVAKQVSRDITDYFYSNFEPQIQLQSEANLFDLRKGLSPRTELEHPLDSRLRAS